jgi:hypothetical protein
VNADRWKQIEGCYRAAMERPVPERAAFLAQACANDPELRRELESLLAIDPADKLLEGPLWDQITHSAETRTFALGALPAGSMMAEYRIAERLGSGGMGEVYRATDTKLQRDVAMKVLASGFAQNSAWMSRFQLEARVLAALNHPHIAAIAMELVEGPTLAERVGPASGHPGRIPIPEALAIRGPAGSYAGRFTEEGQRGADGRGANGRVARRARDSEPSTSATSRPSRCSAISTAIRSA